MGALTMAVALTSSDVEFLSKHREWTRALMTYAILGTTPKPTDLVFICRDPEFNLPFSLPARDFVSLEDLVWKCESAAKNQMIYEAWLADALLNAYRAARRLDQTDAERFLRFFKVYHEIADEEQLVRDALESVVEATRESAQRYGSIDGNRAHVIHFD